MATEAVEVNDAAVTDAVATVSQPGTEKVLGVSEAVTEAVA